MLDPENEMQLSWYRVVFAFLAMLAIFVLQAKMFGKERALPLPPFTDHYGCSARQDTKPGTLAHWTLKGMAANEDGTKVWSTQLGMWDIKTGKEADKIEQKMFKACSEWMRFVESHAKPIAPAEPVTKDPKI